MKCQGIFYSDIVCLFPSDFFKIPFATQTRTEDLRNKVE